MRHCAASASLVLLTLNLESRIKRTHAVQCAQHAVCQSTCDKATSSHGIKVGVVKKTLTKTSRTGDKLFDHIEHPSNLSSHNEALHIEYT